MKTEIKLNQDNIDALVLEALIENSGMYLKEVLGNFNDGTISEEDAISLLQANYVSIMSTICAKTGLATAHYALFKELATKVAWAPLLQDLHREYKKLLAAMSGFMSEDSTPPEPDGEYH